MSEEPRWQDMVAGDRMTVDRDFEDRVRESRFSRQEWGLIMTAAAFEVEHADDPDRARIVADTSDLHHVMPELENVRQSVPSAGGTANDDEGFLSSLTDALGFGGSSDGHDDETEAAESLLDEYAQRLQSHLMSEGRWETVRERAVRQTD